MKSAAYRRVNILEKFKFQPTKNAAYHGRISTAVVSYKLYTQDLLVTW